MTPLHYFQFYVYSFCIHLFTIYTYVVYYSDVISLKFRDELQMEYDYVIVGSGTAGALIAHRLATETNYTFIVLEAGCRSNALMDMPIVGPAIHRSLFDWNFETVPQENACHAMLDNKCRLPQGKIVGGSSKLNNMVHFRGNITSYVEWFHGKHTEDYIRKQFEFIESNILHLNRVQYESELTDAVLQAAKELGYGYLGKEFGKGFMKSRVSQKDGKRWSTSDNLDISKHVATNVLVSKIIILGNTASGVEYLLFGRKRELYAKKGVILAAGTYNTPKILQLSGIGPSKLLKTLDIPVVKDLPVGENLQDHVTTGFDLLVFNDSLSIDASDIVNPINSFQYFLNGKGPLTTPGCEAIGLLSTKNDTEPDLQFMVLPVGISSDRGSRLKKSLGLKEEVWENYFATSFDKHTATILPIILHPKSKGRIFIKSTDVEVPPLIDPNYLSNEGDRESLIKGLELVLEFVGTNAMKAIGAYVNPIPLPGCENYVMFTHSYWSCYIKQLSLTSYHPVGTCSMGAAESMDSVVDTSFKVLGINKLYIADGSVLPTLPSGNINAAIAMMASIFFDVNIKEQYNEYSLCYKRQYFHDTFLKTCGLTESLSGFL